MALFVPLGVPAYEGTIEKGEIKFIIDIEDNNADKLLIQVRQGNSVIYEEEFTDGEMLKVGSHDWYWDGFDKHGILDTKLLTDYTNLNLLSKVWYGDDQVFDTVDFEAEYSEVDWVDVRIDKPAMRIDVLIRVNLTDGGAVGTEDDCKTMGRSRRAPIRTVCPWDEISNEALSNEGKPHIVARDKSFGELKELVIEGVNTYWSRRYSNTEGTIISNQSWEIIVSAENSDDSDISLNDIPLIYNTNNPWSRSGNPGSSDFGDGNSMDELATLLPDGVVQRISYNRGYIYHSNWKEWYPTHPIHQNKGWLYNEEDDENEEFKETSAHELGHEILQAYGGGVYSWQHKGSSYYLPQDTKPVGEESFEEEWINRDFMEHTKGENTPVSGEIDLMKYYNTYSDYKERKVASSEDVVGLIWLTKLNFK